MPFIVKLLAANLVILAASQIGARYPSLGGLIATMPLTSVIVLLWLAPGSQGEPTMLLGYARGALLGIWPSVLFFLALEEGLRHGLTLFPALGLSFAVWLAGAAVHQWLLAG